MLGSPGREFVTDNGERICVSWNRRAQKYTLSITPSSGPIVVGNNGALLTEDDAATLVLALQGQWRP